MAAQKYFDSNERVERVEEEEEHRGGPAHKLLKHNCWKFCENFANILQNFCGNFAKFAREKMIFLEVSKNAEKCVFGREN